VKYLLLVIFAYFISFNLFSHDNHEESDNIQINFSEDNKVNKYNLIINHKNNISSIFFKIDKCKNCTRIDLNDEIICDKNKNIFFDKIICRAPNSRTRNNVVEVNVISRLELTCNKSNNKIMCKTKAITAFDMNAQQDKNALTKLGNLYLEYEISDKKIDEHKDNNNENLSNSDVKPLDVAKNKCLKLGIEEKTEKFADCVLMFYEDN